MDVSDIAEKRIPEITLVLVFLFVVSSIVYGVTESAIIAGLLFTTSTVLFYRLIH